MINILAVVGGAYLVSSFLSTVCPVSREREREREGKALCQHTQYTLHTAQEAQGVRGM